MSSHCCVCFLLFTLSCLPDPCLKAFIPCRQKNKITSLTGMMENNSNNRGCYIRMGKEVNNYIIGFTKLPCYDYTWNGSKGTSLNRFCNVVAVENNIMYRIMRMFSSIPSSTLLFFFFHLFSIQSNLISFFNFKRVQW